MKTKLSVLLLCLCGLTLLAACSNNRQKQKAPAENIAAPIRDFLKQKVSDRNNPEIRKRRITGRKWIYKERILWFDTKDQWVSIGKSMPATCLPPLWMRCKAPPTININRRYHGSNDRPGRVLRFRTETRQQRDTCRTRLRKHRS